MKKPRSENSLTGEQGLDGATRENTQHKDEPLNNISQSTDLI